MRRFKKIVISEFVDNINALLKIDDLYFEKENEFCIDCRVIKKLKIDKRLLNELIDLGILSANKNRYTKVLKFRGKNYRVIVVNKSKFRSLERLILLRNDTNDKDNQIVALNNQLKVKNTQVQSLSVALSKSQKLSEDNQILLEQAQQKIFHLEQLNNKSYWWQFWKKKH